MRNPTLVDYPNGTTCLQSGASEAAVTCGGVQREERLDLRLRRLQRRDQLSDGGVPVFVHRPLVDDAPGVLTVQ